MVGCSSGAIFTKNLFALGACFIPGLSLPLLACLAHMAYLVAYLAPPAWLAHVAYLAYLACPCPLKGSSGLVASCGLFCPSWPIPAPPSMFGYYGLFGISGLFLPLPACLAHMAYLACLAYPYPFHLGGMALTLVKAAIVHSGPC